MCEYLIVGVGTDDFMIRRKNRTSILSYEQRVEIVKAIRYVDEVVPENDLDKIAAYYKYGLDVMIAGEGHRMESVYIDAERELKKMGVAVVYIERKKQCSSTYIRNRIIEMYSKL